MALHQQQLTAQAPRLSLQRADTRAEIRRGHIGRTKVRCCFIACILGRRSLAQDAYGAFFDRSIQYYAAGRFAFLAGLNPVAGNLLHHAIEMCLKGALSKKGTGLSELRKLGHELSDIWNEFKLQASDPSLSRFDAAVSALNEYEELRYPNSVLNKGMLSGFELKRGQAAQVSGLAAAVPRYTLCLEDVDELMSFVFKNASVDPTFFTGALKKQAKQFLSEENAWPVV